MHRGHRQETLPDAATMAHLTQKEFHQAIALMAEELGLQRLRDRLVKLNAFVARRRVASADVLADQMYLLSAGLRRQVAATYAFHALWGELIQAKVGEDGEKRLEELAAAVNACLAEDDSLLAEKAADLDGALAQYEQALSAAVGPARARLDMLLKAVPAVAEKLRAAPLAAGSPAESAPS
jgi:hypothetical protein